MKYIKKAEFFKSVRSSEHLPKEKLSEIVFAGRSNVGKSSLINSLVNIKNLAKTSSSPGKTRAIIFFKIDESFYFVDLPGYGYAKVSKKEQEKWKIMIEDYFSNSKNIKLVVLIIDIRRGVLEKDSELIEYLHYLNYPFVIVLTKYDKVSKNDALKLKRRIEDKIECERVLFFSAKTKYNREELIALIYDYAVKL